MTTRIDALTPEQEAAMGPWAQKWIAKGLRSRTSVGVDGIGVYADTTEAEWASCEDAIRRCYVHAKLSPPKVIVRVGSPLMLAYAGPIAMKVLADLGRGENSNSAVHYAVRSAVHYAASSAVDSAVDSAVRSAVRSAVYLAARSAIHYAVGSAVNSAVHYAVRSAVYSAVNSAVHYAVRSAVYSAVDSAVDSAVGSAVHSAVGSAVGSAVRSAVGSAVRSADYSAWHDLIGGSFWAYWLSYTSYFCDVCKLDLGADLNAREMAYREANTLGWWWPHSEFVILCDRPRVTRLDDAGQLHSATGLPAIEYDGWGLHAWHGVVVPEWMFTEQERITSDSICAEQDKKLRSAMVALAPGPIGVLHALAGDV